MNKIMYWCFLLGMLAMTGCGGLTQPAARTTALGMIFWPPWRDAAEAERLAPLGVGLTLGHSDELYVQLPWAPAAAAATVQQAAWLSGIAAEHHRPLTIALDWQDPSRRMLQGGAGWSFGDSSTRQAFLTTVDQLLTRYHPDRLVLGVEVNYYARLRPGDFAAFVELYREARTRIKGASPATAVLVTFQYELLRGCDPGWPGGEDLAPVHAFGEGLDLLGFSLYPHLAGITAGELPDGYLAGVTALAPAGGWGICETAWPAGNNDAVAAEYLKRLRVQCERYGARLLIWTATMDTAELPATNADAAAFAAAGDWMRRLGLFTREGAAKPAAAVWDRWRASPTGVGNGPAR